MPKLLDILGELGTDEAAFVAKHPLPALLLEPWGGEQAKSQVDTPSGPFATRTGTGASSGKLEKQPPAAGSGRLQQLPGSGSGRFPTPPPRGDNTEVMGALEAARHMARMGEAVHPDARLEWLEKSTRNPFGALITLGRARNNDLIVDHPTVSKVHVIFTRVGREQWTVSDERSANGTFLNGVRLSAGEKRPVSDGDNLRFGPDIVGRFFEPGSVWHFGRMLKAGPQG